MTHKQTVGFAGAAGTLAVMAVFFGWSSRHSAPGTANVSLPPSATPLVAPVAPAASPATSAVEQAANEEPAVPPLPANATHVPDEYLLKLANMVRLTNADEHLIDKERWGRALPIAERLVQAPCDCEQRNWLNHFISMGNDALAGMDEDYYRTAVLMQKMARNDQQLADHPEFFAR